MKVQTGRGDVIVVGGGRVGRRTADQLTDEGYVVTIVERDGEKGSQIPDHVASRVLVGDGADAGVLGRADPGTADVVAGLTNDTKTNLAVCELARESNPDVGTIVRIGKDGEQDYAYLEYVDSVVYPAAAGASVAATRVDRSVASVDG